MPSVHNVTNSLRFPLLLLVVLALFLTAASPAQLKPNACTGVITVAGIDSLGLVTFPTGTAFAGTEVGGLSGIAYDAHRGVYYALSDDRTDARFYTVEIDLSDGNLDPGDVTFHDVTFLTGKGNTDFTPGTLDPEDIDLPRPGFLYITSEGDVDVTPPINPFVNRFNLNGKLTRELPVPEKFLPVPDETTSVRDNLAFESLTSTPDRHFLYTATENALIQDGPIATLTDSSPARVLEYDLDRKRPLAEYVYLVSPIPQAPVPPGAFADNGLVDLQALDNCGTFLAMERSFAVGVGNTIRLFETTTRGATDVSDLEALTQPYDPMLKTLVVDLERDLGIDPDNVEGMIFGPILPDGRITLILVSDNNFNPSQTTQFIALAVELALAAP
jgi:3-phytase/alkaline phosphatase D